MNSTSSTVMEQEKSVAIELPITESGQLQLTEAPEISRDAWKIIIFLLLVEAVFLSSVAAYILSGLHRFQDCL